MKSGVLYLYGGIWEEGEKDFKLRGRNHLFSFCSTHIKKRKKRYKDKIRVRFFVKGPLVIIGK